MDDYFSEEKLSNKLGINDPAELHQAEQRIVSEKMAEIIMDEAPKIFNFAYLLELHRRLFSEIYDFAGKVRTVNIAKAGSVPFANAEFIKPEADRIFGALAKLNYLLNLEQKEFAQTLAHLAVDLNALHPFREGNGRAIRLFLILLAENAGYLLDYSLVPSGELLIADKLAFEGHEDKLVKVYQKIVSKDQAKIQ